MFPTWNLMLILLHGRSVALRKTLTIHSSWNRLGNLWKSSSILLLFWNTTRTTPVRRISFITPFLPLNRLLLTYLWLPPFLFATGQFQLLQLILKLNQFHLQLSRSSLYFTIIAHFQVCLSPQLCFVASCGYSPQHSSFYSIWPERQGNHLLPWFLDVKQQSTSPGLLRRHNVGQCTRWSQSSSPWSSSCS